jgi:hypothetical protein
LLNICEAVDPSSSSGSQTVTVISVAVSPSGASIAPAATQTFTAVVSGMMGALVTWSVNGISGGNSTVGTISTAGLYTAPATAGTYTVTAASTVDVSVTGSQSIIVT